MKDNWETIKKADTETEHVELQKLQGVEQWQVWTSGVGYDAYEVFTTFCDAEKRFLFITNQSDDGIY